MIETIFQKAKTL